MTPDGRTPSATGDFAGLAALVTGGASGIGRATAQVLQERGAGVACLDLDPGEVPAPLVGVEADVTDPASVDSGVAEAVAALGRLDVVVANAGVGAQGTVADHDDTEWHRVLDVNVVGVARTVRACLPHLRRSPSAAVVVTSSIAADAGLPQRALYSASKGAVRALALAMAADHVSDGIRVNAVSPGTVDTPWVGRLLARSQDPAGEREALEARQPHGRLVSPREVGEAVAYLASPHSGSTTGTVLPVDGGMAGLRLRPNS